jgi:hypothetical protein
MRPHSGGKSDKMNAFQHAANAKGFEKERDAEHSRSASIATKTSDPKRPAEHAREAIEHFKSAHNAYLEGAGGKPNFASDRALKSAKATSENYLGEPWDEAKHPRDENGRFT